MSAFGASTRVGCSHRRLRPVEHSFRYRVWMLLLDLDELPEPLDRHPLWSARRPAPVRFRRSDHLGDPALPLADAARDLVARAHRGAPGRAGAPADHAAHARRRLQPGQLLLPVRRATAKRCEAVIAEVTNTPWGERHHYVLERRRPEAALGGRMAKRMHVSPFMPMEQTYEWGSGEPGERLGVRIANRERGELVFEASLALRRRELTPAAMTTVPLSHPPQVIAAIARIYGNAVRLRLKGAPYFPRPRRQRPAPPLQPHRI